MNANEAEAARNVTAPSLRPGEGPVTDRSCPAAKIALFRSLFRGREDVYPRRFESRKTGRAGYQPACANEWVRGVCEKPRIKCGDCPNRRFLPVTDEVVRWHLSGRDEQGRDFVMGVYPDARRMKPVISWRWISIGTVWREDAGAFLETCRRLGLPAALERSRSGNGGHVWLFFEEAMPARLARNLGSHLLTETMESRPEIGLDSYDRLFPNQDTLPKGGFGNLIALPLQKRAAGAGQQRLSGRAIPAAPGPVGVSGFGAEDQPGHGRGLGARGGKPGDGSSGCAWRWLEAEDDAALDGAAVTPPARIRPSPGRCRRAWSWCWGTRSMSPKRNLPPGLRNRLIRLAAFQNPEFYRAQAMRLPTYDKPRIIACAEDHPQHLGLPRGCLEEVQALLQALGIKPVFRDERFGGRPLDVTFRGELRPEQEAAAEAMLAHDTGVLSATTAFGKTVLAAWLIAQRGVNTLVLVHRQQLLEQWIERLSTVSRACRPRTIGRIGGGRKKLTGALDVALMQSLVRKGVVDDRVGDYGHLVVDECHHLSARSFELVARRAKAKFVTGLSATVTRKDGHHPIIFMQCGPVRYRVDAKQQAAARPFTPSGIVRPTGFRAPAMAEADQRVEFQKLYEALVADEARNRVICDDVVSAVREGRSPLVLTERTEHLRTVGGAAVRAGIPT